MSGRERTRWQGVLLVVAVTVLASLLLALLRVPSAPLFGSLFGGMAHALTSTTRIDLPGPAFRVAQATIGVIMGASVSLAALGRMGDDAVAITLVTLGTILISLLAGRVLALRRDVSPVTGAFSMIAGGASGVVAVAHDLGADDRVVTVVQYLRVLLVLVTMPLVTAGGFRPEHGLGSAEGGGARLLPSRA